MATPKRYKYWNKDGSINYAKMGDRKVRNPRGFTGNRSVEYDGPGRTTIYYPDRTLEVSFKETPKEFRSKVNANLKGHVRSREKGNQVIITKTVRDEVRRIGESEKQAQYAKVKEREQAKKAQAKARAKARAQQAKEREQAKKAQAKARAKARAKKKRMSEAELNRRIRANVRNAKNAKVQYVPVPKGFVPANSDRLYEHESRWAEPKFE